MAKVVVEAFLSSFFQVILEKLVSTDFKDYFSRNKLDVGLVDNLGMRLNSINQVLEEAEKMQYQSTNIKKWLDDLEHVVYEVDQLLDEIATDAQLSKVEADSESKSVTSMAPSFLSPFARTFESRIKELLEKLEFLANQKEMVGLKGGDCTSNEGGSCWKPSKRSTVDESSIYGRDSDKEEVIKFLLSDNERGNQVPILSIVGLSGMGKTTLAQLVYNDHRIKEHFGRIAWVHVSESCDVVGLTKEIIVRLLHSLADNEDLNILQRQLQQRLAGQRYLLVLDDVWNKKGKCWEQILLPFNHGSFGSKIVVTTRDKEVASIMKSTQLLHLKKLDERDSWSLFLRHAFHGQNVSEYSTLGTTCQKIVEKCGGIPIAIKTLANILRVKFPPSEWVKILETEVWRLLDGDSNICVNQIQRFCYHCLPSNLKRCFAYCSIFPKGYHLDKDQITKLWMADGLLKCCGIDKSEEELGNEFFNDLESISFFQQSLYPGRDNKYHFVMHDLVIDLAKSVSRELCLRIEGDRVGDFPKRIRHIWCSVDLKDGDIKLEQIYKITGLRSLTIHTQRSYGSERFRICNNVQRDLFSRLKYLRMLSFHCCNLLELVDEICCLTLLRYLDLSSTMITNLPDSICRLYNLQTLLLENCFKLTELPSDFCKLVNLRHLNLKGTYINKMPNQIGKLKHLRTLTDFVVGENGGSHIKELAKCNHLQGALHISGLENVTHPAFAREANFKGKEHLAELVMRYGLGYGNGRETDGSIIERDVLEALKPNNNLNTLIIQGYCGNSFPNWLGECHLPNLVSLELHGCEFCSQLPPLGQLPSLKELSISSCYRIEIIDGEFYGNNSSNVPFMSLEILGFNDMPNWNKWLCPRGFPSLKELFITDCPKLIRAMPQHLPSLKRLVIFGCQELEASIPANIQELELSDCENILMNEMPSRLKRIFLGGTRVIESSLEQILLNNAFLEKLGIGDFDGANLKWPSLDLLSCNSLQSLSISGWGSSCLPFALHSFINLHSLDLYDCQLELFPHGGLPSSLRSLRINKCSKLIASRKEWGLFELNSLKDFRVSDDFENIESFPEENLLPPSLNSLRLENCSKLRVINYKGLLHLKSLTFLGIEYCPCLERLPEKGLPNSISTLFIHDCSLLKQQYQEEKGENWHEIRHIPNVIIF